MSDVHTAEQARAVARNRQDRLLDRCQTAVYLYGAFVLGVLACALGLGAEGVLTACIPFSALFVILVGGLTAWRRRRQRTAD
jgi:hypothetical protein